MGLRTFIFRKPHHGSHILSLVGCRIVEHKRFRLFFGVCLIVILLFASNFRQIAAFSENDFKAGPIATEEVTIATKKTSRLPVVGGLSQGFSYYHPGIDIEDSFNDPIHPMLSGVIAETGFQAGGYGNYVLIDHQNGYFSLYAHLNKVFVKKGDETSQDNQIGTVGVTGRSTGSHLHFEVYENGIALNPLVVLPEVSVSSTSGNTKAFIGGPSSIPSLTLSLPISETPVLSFDSKSVKKKDKLSLSTEEAKEQSSAIPR